MSRCVASAKGREPVPPVAPTGRRGLTGDTWVSTGICLVLGLGLGLYTSQRIAEAHGGTLSVRSELGRGSTFRLEVPRGG
ncbi:MAG: HAMP domain-containing histidine kinase [Deltaproteobacteria bacterium]|nr:HAMP domain-containing histidine kinase [Deltaproteobacteria bacterium]